MAKASSSFQWDSQEEIGEVSKGARGDSIVVSVCKTGGRTFIDVRTHFLNASDERTPTGKGIAIPLNLVKQIMELMQDAVDAEEV